MYHIITQFIDWKYTINDILQACGRHKENGKGIDIYIIYIYNISIIYIYIYSLLFSKVYYRKFIQMYTNLHIEHKSAWGKYTYVVYCAVHTVEYAPKKHNMHV